MAHPCRSLRVLRVPCLRLAAAALLAAGCGGATPPVPTPAPPAVRAPIAAVAVLPAPDLPARAVVLLEEARAPDVLRQSALDWLEQEGRLDPAGGSVRVEVESLELRTPAVAWLFSALAGPDRLTVRVTLRRDGEAVRAFRAGAASALSGYAWRDRGERLRRLARRVGHRVAEGL